MFGAQMPRGTQNMSYAGMDQREINAIAEIVGQCRANLQHRGSVENFGPVTNSGTSKFKGPSVFRHDVTFGPPGGGVGPQRDVVFNYPVEFNGDIEFSRTTDKSIRPQYIELTSDMASSATAKFKLWNGSSYIDASEDAITVYDPLKIAGNAFEGQQGWCVYDSARGAYVVSSMSAPILRIGSVDTALTSGSHQTFEDASDGTTFEVYGTMVKSGWQIPTTALIAAFWSQASNSGDGQWEAIAINDCLVETP